MYTHNFILLCFSQMGKIRFVKRSHKKIQQRMKMYENRYEKEPALTRPYKQHLHFAPNMEKYASAHPIRKLLII